MAKFKVGDSVEIVGSGLASKGWVGTVKSVGDGGGWNIKVQFPAGKYSNDYGEYNENELYKVRNSASRSSNPVVANALKAVNGVAMNASARSLDKYGALCKQLHDIGREYRRLNPIVVKEIDALEGNDKEAYKDACRKFNAFSDLVPYHLSDGLVMQINIPMKY